MMASTIQSLLFSPYLGWLSPMEICPLSVKRRSFLRRQRQDRRCSLVRDYPVYFVITRYRKILQAKNAIQKIKTTLTLFLNHNLERN